MAVVGSLLTQSAHVGFQEQLTEGRAPTGGAPELHCEQLSPLCQWEVRGGVGGDFS